MTPSQPDPDVPADSPEDIVSPDTPAPARSLDRSLDLVRFLRAHCEWDAAQTPDSLIPYLLEEAHEVAEAIASHDDVELVAELGDLLLNVAFQVVLGEERGAFTAEDVVRSLESKMRRRHPHLYGDGPRTDWELLKQRERSEAAPGDSILEGVAVGLEPLSRAHRIQERVASVGFDWPDAREALDKVREETDEVAEHIGDPARPELEDEIGDLLFAVVNVARLSGVHPMRALLRANAKFVSRFTALEALARDDGLVLGSASLAELERLWEKVKQSGSGSVR